MKYWVNSIDISDQWKKEAEVLGDYLQYVYYLFHNTILVARGNNWLREKTNKAPEDYYGN